MRHKSAADYAAIAVAPVLIFLMIAALASFLTTVMYRGGYSARIQYILLMFTMGAVALARLAIEKDRAYSLGYAVGLGGATFLVMAKFVGNPIISLVTIVVIGVLADIIVRDCTLIDENDDSSDKGLLESGFKGLWGGNRSGHQPGRTVLLLAIAALPLFGLGQFFLAGSSSAWAGAQKFLAMYLFAALSLLVTTSFLGLRRYLRQRGAEMPSNVAAAWLGGGVAMIAVILLLATLTPMPGSAIANFQLPEFLIAKQDQTASQQGWGSEGTGKQNADAKQPSDAKKIVDENSEAGKPVTKKGAKSGDADSGDRKDGPPGDKGGGDAKGAAKGKGDKKTGGEKNPGSDQQKSSKQGDPENGDQDKQPTPNDSDSSKSNNDATENSSDKDSDNSSNENSENSSNENPDDEQTSNESNDPPQQQQQQQQQQSKSSSASQQTSPPPSPSFAPSASAITGLVKLLVLFGCLGIVGWFIHKHAAEIAAWWRSLRADPAIDQPNDQPANKAPSAKSARPFSSFRNPFKTEASPTQTIVTTFAALQAYAGERGVLRSPDETPAEFQRRLIHAIPELAAPSAGVIDAYNGLVYGGDKDPGPAGLEAARELWQTMMPLANAV